MKKPSLSRPGNGGGATYCKLFTWQRFCGLIDPNGSGRLEDRQSFIC